MCVKCVHLLASALEKKFLQVVFNGGVQIVHLFCGLICVLKKCVTFVMNQLFYELEMKVNDLFDKFMLSLLTSLSSSRGEDY